MQPFIKTTYLIIALMSVVVACPWAAAAASSDDSNASALNGPKAIFPVTKYEFKPLFEGEDVTHDFVVENRGDAPLVIKKVKPG